MIRIYRHIHVSLRDADGKNVFAVSDGEKESGRKGAANDDVKFMSQEGEWFLAGVLNGLADGELAAATFPLIAPDGQGSDAYGELLCGHSIRLLKTPARANYQRVQTSGRR
jgi:hypothetical protein